MRTRCGVWLAFGVVACGRVDFDGTSDAIAHVSAEAAAADTACPLGPFGAARNLGELNTTADDWGPWLSADKLTIVYSGNLTGQYQGYTATRGTTADPFGPASLVPTDYTGAMNDPYESPDGLTLWFDDHGGSDTVKLETRTDVTQAFGNVVTPAELLDNASIDPSLTADQLTIAFDSGRPGGPGGSDLWITSRSSPTGTFAAPAPIDALNTTAYECCPDFAESEDALLYISAFATGTPAMMRSTRSGTTFAAPTRFAPELAGDGDDLDPYLTPDGRTLIFASSRSGGAGNHDLYLAERGCE